MEGVLPLRVDREYFPDEPRLHHLRLPKHSATEPSRISGSQPRPSLHAGHQLRYQHKPSTLQRRRSLQQSAELLPAIIDAWSLLSQPDDRGPVRTVHQCSHWPLRRSSNGARLRFSQSEFGKLLHWLCPVSDPTLPSALCCRGPDLCGTRGSPDDWRLSNRNDGGGSDPDNSGGPRRIASQHHADRHQWWRIFRS